MFIIFSFFRFPFLFLFFYFLRPDPPPATRYPSPATRHPSPVTRQPRKSSADRLGYCEGTPGWKQYKVLEAFVLRECGLQKLALERIMGIMDH